MQKQNLYTMEDLIPVMQEFFAEGKKVIITATGNSMRPLIRHKKDAIVLTAYKGESLKVGDVAFYKRSDSKYVLHRIIDISEDGSFVMLGDNQTITEKGIKKEQIIAVPTAIIRDGKTLRANSKQYLRYTKLWTNSKFLRRLQIAFFHLKIRISKITKKFL